MDAAAGARAAVGARAVPPLAPERARPRLRRLRSAVAMVGRGPRRLLGVALGLLRDQAHTPYERVLGSREMPGAKWFPGARLNYAEHMLGRDEDAGSVAVVARSQSRGPSEVTFGELREQVARARAGLRRLGIGPGDRVVAYLPNIPGDARRLPRHRQPRRRLGDLSAGVRRSQRPPPPRPARAEGAARRRGLSLGRPVRRPSRAGGRRPRGASEPRGRRACAVRGRPGRCPPRDARLGRAPGRALAARVRAGPVRPSALRPLLLRAPRACRRRSSTGTAASCSSTRRTMRSHGTSARATGSSGSRRRRG